MDTTDGALSDARKKKRPWRAKVRREAKKARLAAERLSEVGDERAAAPLDSGILTNPY